MNEIEDFESAYEANLQRTPLPDPSQTDQDQDTLPEDFQAARGLVTIVANTEQADAYLKHQMDIATHRWERLCLSLQRTARNIPPLAASAFISANMTPAKYRVKLTDLRRGMICYSWNPSSPGAGHIFEILGRSAKHNTWLTRTNDAFEPGAVDVVAIEFYHEHWGHDLQFGAIWVNGFEFPDWDAPFNPVAKPIKPKPPVVHDHARLGQNFDDSIKELKQAIKAHEKHQATEKDRKLVRQLNRQLDHMIELRKRWK